MSQDVKPNSVQDYFGAIFLMGLFVAGFFIYSKITTTQPPNDGGAKPPVEKSVVSCPPNLLSYTTVSQKVKLFPQRIAMFAENGKFVNPQIVVAKSETADSKVACGYFFVRAGTGNNGALRSWENVYINPNMFGGHIISKNAISINDGQQFSEYLFSLDKITYWPTSAHKSVLTSNWAYLLNVSNQINFDVALNTNDQSGFIDDITIAYKCWNPITGEENTDCKLYVASSTEKESSTPTK